MSGFMDVDRITRVSGRAERDVFGAPCLAVEVETAAGVIGRGVAPRGWTLAFHDRVDRRDGEPRREGGLGLEAAIASVHEELSPRLVGRRASAQSECDDVLARMDGTGHSLRLGVNVTYSTSIALARAAAAAREEPLHRYLGGVYGEPYRRYGVTPVVPLLAGGAQGEGRLPIRSILLLPLGPATAATKRALLERVHQVTRASLEARGRLLGVAPDGGLEARLDGADAPARIRQALSLATEAIRAADARPGVDVATGLHVDADRLYEHPVYRLDGRPVSRQELLAFYEASAEDFAVRWIEDGFSRVDLAGWEASRRAFSSRPDLLLLANEQVPSTIQDLRRLLALDLFNAAALKPDRAGTLTAAFAFVQELGHHDVLPLMAARTRATSDPFLADLACATGTSAVRFGGLGGAHWVARLARLEEIEADT
jgi:enolase